MGSEAQQEQTFPDTARGGKQEEDEEEEQPGDWAALVRSGILDSRF